ncbi:hypothetical protein GOP47_0023018 [Adiantum capillus-veneris]|uniref:Uncharacterized protein n=1 Tax=Adiantum capillus-veneris TaxID=13818 RepID=A0A9D4U6I1_ADICA|nr:hypothetical protein GOP47_0023018 [Adiantum capillus-veneris]
MAIARDNRLLSMGHSNVDGWRHTLLRKVAQLLPRVERCNREDCEVFSGIFGNILWHENLTPRMHEWMNNEITTKLSLGALRHLHLVCLAGRIVDANGNDTYLQHPERLALPTTYISGGREILVMLDTSSMAHSFMQFHHPSFSHSRIVVPKYGHNDLLIGEHSGRDVFPHILDHLERFSRTKTSQHNEGKEDQHKCSRINPSEVEGMLKRSNFNLLSVMDNVTYLCCFMLIIAIFFLSK